ncbi:tyrosine-type recombinase/integrase [Mycobacterium sp. E136]|uniref:tyrosine-type recombinase/integrase n=1 Tax=Mycobacterium sp. E136 TaxID=1834125 RepID=UPI0012E79D74|nr:tyrosine-type recombinase/integrase [Mycobacterium sp. E136]
MADNKVSRKTIQNKHAFLSAAFKQAVKDGLIGANPCEDRRLPETRPREKVFLTAAEFELIRSKLPEKYRPFATFLVMTGLRYSEATALTPDDVDLVKKTVTVN